MLRRSARSLELGVPSLRDRSGGQRLRFASLHLLSIAEACESLSSAKVMAGNIANSIGGPEGNPLLALQQLIMLNELLVNRLLDKLRLPQ
ncbi:DUF6124 family protein [Pseudomonas putida]|uniref:Uncharacterized protein n=1 Tax=Pseudomonas putida TaxID=303 RepID=A0A2C5WFF7_PSEPU|nr:hypothetical protein [Pseudomonas putida]PHH43412.1 hypothetical protein CRX57_25430 [Pseudomonas putida]